MKLKLKKIHTPLLSITLILCVVGLTVMYSASAVKSSQTYGYNYYFLSRQALAVVIGIISMLVISRIEYHLFKKYSPLIMLAAMCMLILVLIPGVGTEVGNARRWFTIASISVQPVEFAKLALIIYLAAWLDARAQLRHSFFNGLLGALVVMGITAGLVIKEPDFGSAISLVLIGGNVIFASGIKLRYLLSVAASGALVGWLAILGAPHALSRIKTFLNPQLDRLGAGYQINQALLAIGSGGLWGFGLGKSRQKFNFLPEPIGDSIFAIMSEELGFVRVMLVLLLYLALAIVGLRIAKHAPDNFGRLVAVGMTTWVLAQTSINIGAMLGLFPLTGIPLPFISYGGSAMIALLTGIGIMLNISRHRQ